jgi:hypothetical protein
MARWALLSLGWIFGGIGIFAAAAWILTLYWPGPVRLITVVLFSTAGFAIVRIAKRFPPSRFRFHAVAGLLLGLLIGFLVLALVAPLYLSLQK